MPPYHVVTREATNSFSSADGVVVRYHPAAWAAADARFERGEANSGSWSNRRELPGKWTIAHEPLVFELKRTEFGHLGLFAEQAANWDWIAAQVAAAGGIGDVRKDKNLNPLNTDFDLYSLGEDGASASPLTAKNSRDDIVRANNGAYIGLGEDY